MQLVQALKPHKDKVWDVSVHPTLPLLASASSDKKCHVYSLESMKLMGVLEDDAHKKTIRSVSWKPNCQVPALAAGSFDSTISIWSKEEHASSLEEAYGLMAIIEGHENEVKGVDWSYDGVFLASCSRDKSCWIWEADDNNEEFECINVIQEHSQDVKHCVWHPSELILATCSYDDTIKLFKQDPYDEDDWLCLATLPHSGTVWCADFSKSGPGTRLCSCSDDAVARIWKRCVSDTGTPMADSIPSTIRPQRVGEEWEEECILPSVHTGPIYAISWNKENGLIATAGSDGVIAVYRENGSQWEVVDRVDKSHGVFEVNCLAWFGDLLVSGGDDGCVNVWKSI